MRHLFAPVFLLSLAFLALVHSFQISNYRIIYALAAMLFFFGLGYLAFKWTKTSYFLIVLALVLLIGGKFVEQKHDFLQIAKTSFITPSQTNVPESAYVNISGELIAFPEIQSDHSIIVLAARKIQYKRESFHVAFNVRIKVKGNMSYLYRGDRVAIDARIYPGRFNKNFFPNPMENFRLVRKIHFNGYCKSSLLVMVLEKSSWYWRVVGQWRNRIRAAIVKKYKTLDDGSGSSRQMDAKGVLLQAILIGDRGELTGRQKEMLISAGVFHLLAISGAHIGIIALGCLLLLKWCGVSFKKRYIITVCVLLLFLLLSGFKVSAERAVIMAGLIFLARIMYLDIEIYNIITFSGLLLLMINPAQFLDAGFILTFALTAAIVTGRKVFLPPVAPLLAINRSTGFMHMNPESGAEKHAYWKELLCAGFSASLIALPLSLFYFKRYSFAGFFAGLLLIPLIAVILGFAFLLIPITILSSGLSQIILMVIDIPLTLFFALVRFFSTSIDLTIYRPSPSILWVLFIMILFGLLAASWKRTQKIILSALILNLIIGISINIFPYAPKHLQVFYLDVGQGDSQVVVFPGGDALLIDGGGNYYSDFQVGKNIVLPFLLQKRIRIKWVAVSHYHADHVKGIIELLKILKPEQLWLSSEAVEEPLYRQLLAVKPKSTEIVKIAAPMKMPIGECTLQFLNPEGFVSESGADNNQSHVIRISDGFHSFLFTGDIQKESESRLVANFCDQVNADVIKVPHHGSRTSSTLEFIKCVSPRLAIFSYAVNNRFRFPHPSVVNNYKKQKILSLATADRGGIQLISLPERIQIETSK
jgi:competence protein ComEC